MSKISMKNTVDKDKKAIADQRRAVLDYARSSVKTIQHHLRRGYEDPQAAQKLLQETAELLKRVK